MSAVALRAYLYAMEIGVSREEYRDVPALRSKLIAKLDELGVDAWSYQGVTPCVHSSKRRKCDSAVATV